MDTSCIFCKIISGQVETNKIDETEDCIVIPDISAQAPIHLLFVSKTHGEEFASVDAAKLSRMMGKVKAVIQDKKLDQLSYRVIMNGVGATIVHNHLHIHLLGSVSHDRPV